MHTIEKKEIIPVIILVTQFQTWECRKLHFRESNSTNFPVGGGGGGACPAPRQGFVLPALNVRASGTNGARPPAEPLYLVLPNATENPV